MKFGGDLRAFSHATGITMDRAMRKIHMDLLTDIVRMTPVDTGLARSSWYCGYEVVSEVGTESDKSGGPSLARGAQFAASLHAGGVYYIANNLPYIMALEYGHSGQAPSGMVRIAVARAQSMVNRMGGGGL